MKQYLVTVQEDKNNFQESLISFVEIYSNNKNCETWIHEMIPPINGRWNALGLKFIWASSDKNFINHNQS